jgi:hypothetical protein
MPGQKKFILRRMMIILQFKIGSMTKLEKLLFDITPTKIKLEDAEKIFYNTAVELMLKYILKTSMTEYYLTEIEFYLFSEFHQDKSTNCHPLQKNTSHWYFHRFGKKDTVIIHNRKGVDIVFGNEECWGGILIKGIQNTANEKDYVYGQSKVVDRIISDSGNSLSSIAKNIEKEEISINPLLSLKETGVF